MALAPSLNVVCVAGPLVGPFSDKSSSNRFLQLRTKPISSLRLSCFHPFSSRPFLLTLTKKKIPLFLSLVVKTSDWRKDEEDIGEDELGQLEGQGPEADLSEWEDEDQFEEESAGEAFAEVDGQVSEEYIEGEESYPEPSEDAKLFVGNLPYDVDCQKLAFLFQNAGTVEMAEVIYSRETDQSRGFGFVTMSTVEEAEKAVELFHQYDCNGRLLTVNKAAPRGSIPERPTREIEPPLKIYVGNLPWQVDDSRLEEIFSEHGKVVNAKVIYNRETGRSKGFGFVTMASKSELDDAIAALDGQNLDGRTIRVNVAEETPRRGSF
ncbi:hypothetical protein HPP92_009704 [Vanilla planifolia]|uniref:RRM domain-containing protein n=1 Tax=Vanilla planifolia TaxID=51239 RepID=A0A835RAS2_VANPL|nr:hypothetical protein HPP92_009923 [Vanilla planifolia]KAG0487609.1 hypothetical protein HPP92_009704 [Vanilla planifolia]